MKQKSTPYDDVFRTLANDCKQLVIPLINEMFEEHYRFDEEVILLQNEHFMRQQDGEEDEIITDSCIMIGTKKYHIECQSTPDGSMAVRMFEYDAQIALDGGSLENHVLKIRFPESAVLYLRSTKNTPDEMTVIIDTPGGEVEYHMPILKIKDYSLEDIFIKELYFLIPFYLFTFESRFDKMESDEQQMDILRREYSSIIDRLNELVAVGKVSEFTKSSIVEMTKKVADNLAVKYDKVKEEVSDIMGGKILQYKAKDILNEGIRQGIRQGKQEGIQQGLREKGMLCYLNAITRGMSHEDAIAIAGISEEDAVSAVSLRESGEL